MGNEEHKITEKVVDAGAKAMTAAKSVDDKYKISDKVKVGAGAVVAKAKDIEDKHKVTDKVASGVSFGLGRLSSGLESLAQRASQGGKGAGPYPGGGAAGGASGA